jgi:hypothetical protein
MVATDEHRLAFARLTLTADDRDYSVMMEIEPGKLLLESNTSEGELTADVYG